MADVTPVETAWLWPGYFPKGAIVDLVGDAGLGKSQLMIELAARISRGDHFPTDSSGRVFAKRDVLFLSAEDDPKRTIRPRLDAAQADVTKVHALQAKISVDDGEERVISLPLDVDLIEEIVVEHSVSLVVIDPYEAYVGQGLNTNSNTDNRKCLTPLARMAERTGATVVLVQHLNKKEDVRAIYRPAGSVAIVATSRAVYAVAADPEDPERRILACIKCNLGPMPKALTFAIEPAGNVSRVVWTGTSDQTAGDILGSSSKSNSGKLARAKEIIEDILAARPTDAEEVFLACRAEGISHATFKRARGALKVKTSKSGFKSGWQLSLPETPLVSSDDDFPA